MLLVAQLLLLVMTTATWAFYEGLRGLPHKGSIMPKWLSVDLIFGTLVLIVYATAWRGWPLLVLGIGSIGYWADVTALKWGIDASDRKDKPRDGGLQS